MNHALFTIQVVLDVSAVIGFAMFTWWALEAKSALRAALVSNRMLSRALAQADVDALDGKTRRSYSKPTVTRWTMRP